MASFADLHDLTGKAAVVTGGSRGTGRAIARHVGRWADCDALVTETVDRFGRLDVLAAAPPEGADVPFGLTRKV